MARAMGGEDKEMIEQGSREWLEERRKGIGGSDAAAVVGLSRWATPYQVWLSKRGDDTYAVEESERMYWGKRMEPLLREEYERRTGHAVEVIPEIRRHPEFPWMAGSLDGMCVSGGRGVEFKCTEFPDEWGEPDTDQIPMEYLIQVHHYMIVLDVHEFHVCPLFRGNQFRIYRVEANNQVRESLIAAEAAFWRRVKEGEPPPPVNVDDAVRRWGRLSVAGSVLAEPQVEEAVALLARLKREEKENRLRQGEMKATIFSALQDRGDTLCNARGDVLATWKMRRGWTQTVTHKDGRFLVLKGDKNGDA